MEGLKRKRKRVKHRKESNEEDRVKRKWKGSSGKEKESNNLGKSQTKKIESNGHERAQAENARVKQPRKESNKEGKESNEGRSPTK